MQKLLVIGHELYGGGVLRIATEVLLQMPMMVVMTMALLGLLLLFFLLLSLSTRGEFWRALAVL